MHRSPSRFKSFVKEFVVLPRLADLLIEGPGQMVAYRRNPSVFVDISKVGVWKEAQKLSDPELALRVPQLLDLVLVSNVPSTTTTYS